jgi:hypothetical protein
MIAGAWLVLWQRRAGILAMVCLVSALLALADALVGGFGGSHGVIQLIPDNRYPISGPMPPKTEAIKDFVIDGQPGDGSVRLVPETIFSGYWLGGSMWRGAIVVEPSAREGNHVISVKDKYGEKQNPALVFTIKIWPDQTTLNANSASFITRKTNLSPYLFAVGLALCGFTAAGANFLLGRLWSRHLAAHNCGEIYKLQRTERGTEITCELRSGGTLRPGMAGAVYRPSGEHLCSATISSCEEGEVLMLVSNPELVHLGDVACVSSEVAELAAS